MQIQLPKNTFKTWKKDEHIGGFASSSPPPLVDLECMNVNEIIGKWKAFYTIYLRKATYMYHAGINAKAINSDSSFCQ